MCSASSIQRVDGPFPALYSRNAARRAGEMRGSVERGRSSSRLLRHPKLLPYMPKISPFLPQLAPHAQRLVDSVELVGPWIPVLVPELPRMLAHLGPLLDELPHLEPYLAIVVAHRDPLLTALDHLAPHLPALRPHLPALAAGLPIFAPHIPRLAPYLAALLPHLEPLIAHARELEPALVDLLSDEVLPSLLPHVGVIAAHVEALTPHFPALAVDLQRGPDSALRPNLAALFAALPVLLPHMASLLRNAAEFGPRLPALLAEPEALASWCELEARAAADAAAADACGDGGVWAPLAGMLRFFGTSADADGGAAAGTNGRAEEGEGAPTAPDLGRINAAIDATARRMAALEMEFRECKQTHTFRSTQEQEAALRCARMESTLADVDDALVALASKLATAEARIEREEKAVGPEALSQAREARIVERINGRRGSFVTLAPVHANSDSPHHPSSLPPVPGLELGRQKSLLGTIEDTWLSKLSL